jgi:hypothetical protein
VGIKMLARRKLEFKPSRVRALNEIAPFIKGYTGELT